MIITLVLAVALVLSLALSTSGAQAGDVTLKSATIINDYEIVLEFSEPIALNYHGTNYGPFIDVRMCNALGGILYTVDEGGNPENPMYWGCKHNA